MLSELILDLGKCPNQKTHESESACFLVGEEKLFFSFLKSLWPTFLNFTNRTAQNEIALSSFFPKRKEEKFNKIPKYINYFHAMNFSAKYDNIWENDNFFS